MLILLLGLLVFPSGTHSHDQLNTDDASKCPDDYITAYKHCRYGEIAVPLPFACIEKNVSMPLIETTCLKGENVLMLKNEGLQIFENDFRIYPENENIAIPQSKTTDNKWHITLDRMRNIYAIAVRGITHEQYISGLTVIIIKRVSSAQHESFKCSYNEEDHYTGFLIFYCFLHAPMQLGIEAHSIQIIGNITTNSCDFFKSVEVFSYPAKMCGSPIVYKDQRISPSMSLYLIGQSITYECTEEHHILVGNANQKCLQSGFWSDKTPVCIKVKSFKPYVVRTLDQNHQYKSTKIKTSPITLNPNQTITYLFSTDYCIERIQITFYSIDSNVTVFSTFPGKEEYSWKESSYYSGTTKHYLPLERFKCASNFSVHRYKDQYYKHPEIIYKVLIFGFRKSEIVSARPSCLDFYPSFPHTRSILLKSTVDDGIVNLNLICDDGFKMHNQTMTSPAIMSCNNGSWQYGFHQVPLCQRHFCALPKKVDHSTWKYVRSKSGASFDSVLYECHAGYKLFGINILSCHNGTWSPIPPVCEITYCPSLQHHSWNQSRGIITLDERRIFIDNKDTSKIHHGLTLHFQCYEGFQLIGSSRITCNNSVWTSEPPTCKQIMCSHPNTLTILSTPSAKEWRMGHHSFTCPEGKYVDGYENQSTFSMYCQENGKWREDYNCVEQQSAALVIYLSIGIFLIAVNMLIVIFYFSLKR